MKVFCAGKACIQHQVTGEVYEIKSSDLEWDEEGVGEGSMGPESDYRAVVEHPELGSLVWSLGEYPSGIEDRRETNVGPHKLLNDFKYGLEHEPEPPDGPQ